MELVNSVNSSFLHSDIHSFLRFLLFKAAKVPLFSAPANMVMYFFVSLAQEFIECLLNPNTGQILGIIIREETSEVLGI